MKDKIELLAPAGDWDAFLAAVENGADAVYLGGKLFNARQFAGNFDIEKLRDAFEYAHVRGVKVYLTMNTLLSNSEIKEAVEFVEQVYVLGVDGIIVQDLGFAGLIRNLFPELPLHASTQMTIYNVEGVKVLEKLGFKRAVLARELSIDEIKAIGDNTSLELEVFAHGALCICYSGQCLMSSIIGGRSGNRGKCAQPCRLPFELISNSGKINAKKEVGKYILSPKDLCSINEQYDLIKAGVKSIKIEGRMKSSEYVAKVVETYRKYLDLAYNRTLTKDEKEISINEDDLKSLTQIFNRGGFTKGYLKGKTGRDMMSFAKPKNWGVYLGEIISYNSYSKTIKLKLEEDLGNGDGVEVWNGEEESPGTVISEIKVNGKNTPLVAKGNIVEIGYISGRIEAGNKIYKTSDKLLNAKARETYTGKSQKKLKLNGKVVIKSGQPVYLSIWDDSGNNFEIIGEILPEAAINKALSKERVDEQIRKTGATPFEIGNLDIQLEEGLSIPLSELNSMRRKALEEVEKKIIEENTRNLPQNYSENKEKLIYFPGNSRNNLLKAKLSAFFHDFNVDIDVTKLNIDRIYLPFKFFLEDNNEENIKIMKENKLEVFPWLPSITKGNYDTLIRNNLKKVVDKGIDGILVGNPGSIWIKDAFPQLKLVCDSSFNVFNSFTIKELFKLGVNNFTYSLELNLNQISKFDVQEDILREAVVYGRIAVMASEYCPVGSVEGGLGTESKCTKPCIKGVYKLKDRMGMEFPVYCDRIDCRSVIYNSNVMFTLDSLEKIRKAGTDIFRMNFTDERPEEVVELINAYRDVLENGNRRIDKYGKLIGRIKDKGFTKGHYFRGV
jgi:U32 family peptidase